MAAFVNVTSLMPLAIEKAALGVPGGCGVPLIEMPVCAKPVIGDSATVMLVPTASVPSAMQ
jgi:hypothetical protein